MLCDCTQVCEDASNDWKTSEVMRLPFHGHNVTRKEFESLVHDLEPRSLSEAMSTARAHGDRAKSVFPQGSCEAWCTNPCAELNGNTVEECGSCEGDDYACRPGTADFGSN